MQHPSVSRSCGLAIKVTAEDLTEYTMSTREFVTSWPFFEAGSKYTGASDSCRAYKDRQENGAEGKSKAMRRSMRVA